MLDLPHVANVTALYFQQKQISGVFLIHMNVQINMVNKIHEMKKVSCIGFLKTVLGGILGNIRDKEKDI